MSEDLQEGIEEGEKRREEVEETNIGCPIMTVKINDKKYNAIVDTGSSQTCISEAVYEELRQGGDVEELPVVGLRIYNPIGNKYVQIRKQVEVAIEIDEKRIDTIFLVIPQLSTEMIIGSEWLYKNKCVIDYEKVAIRIRNVWISPSRVSFETALAPEHRSANVNERKMRVNILTSQVVSEVGNGTVNKSERRELEESESRDDSVMDIGKLFESEEKYDKQTKRSRVKEVDREETEKACKLEIYNIRNDEIREKDSSHIQLNTKAREINRELGAEDGNGKIGGKGEEDEEKEYSWDDICTQVRRISELKDQQKQALSEIIYKNKKVVENRLEGTNIYEHSIKLNSKRPFVYKSYPIPIHYRTVVEKEMQKLLRQGIIERSSSEYCNPLRIVKKVNGEVRICLDARMLNKYVIDDNESPPLIEEIVQKHEGVQYMTSLDLRSGYWQIPLEAASSKFTAFVHNGSVYQFCRVPFGLKTAGSAFMRAIRKALGNSFDSFITTYIDDILITSRSFEEHLQHLDKILRTLNRYNFKLNLEKARFCCTEIPFLGVILSREGIRPNSDKIKAIQNFVVPANKAQLQQFLGLCNFYRRFNQNHATLIEPFRELLSSKNRWKWSAKYQEAFIEIKKAFVKTICLYHYKYDRPFILQTGASNSGISGVLYQYDDQKNQRIVSIVSRCLTKYEINYTTTEKEMLAIVYAVTKLRTYLLGRHFHIITDHKALTFFTSASYYNSRLMRWNLLLQQYSFTTHYCTGRENVVADFFSRNALDDRSTLNDQECTILALQKRISKMQNNKNRDAARNSGVNLFPEMGLKNEIKSIRKLQMDDEETSTIIQNIQNNREITGYGIHESVLFQKSRLANAWRLVIPQGFVKKLIDEIHNNLGHVGIYKISKYVDKLYFWKKMHKDIKKTIRECDLCQRTKSSNVAMSGEYCAIIPSAPHQLITVDLFGPLPKSRAGMQYIFVVLDAFSKYVSLYPIKKATANTCVQKMLNNYIAKHGKPQAILSDNGTQFTSRVWKEKLQQEGIKIQYSSIRHPQSNPTERVMRELGRMLRTFCDRRHTAWANHIDKIEQILNVTTHHSTGFIPYELQYGEDPLFKIKELIKYPESRQMPLNTKIQIALVNLKENAERRKRNQKCISKIKLKVGDLVLLRVPHMSKAIDNTIKKLFHLYEGPYRISKSYDNNAFELCDISDCAKIIGIHNSQFLKKYYKADET